MGRSPRRQTIHTERHSKKERIKLDPSMGRQRPLQRHRQYKAGVDGEVSSFLTAHQHKKAI